MLTVLDLFAGIGAVTYALKQSGPFSTAAFCEIDRDCQAVLSKRFPSVPIYPDIKTLRGDEAGHVDVVTFSLPCQPFSSASRGRRATIHDDRWLWSDVLRIISVARPSWIVCENAAEFDGVALEMVCADLEATSYRVQPFEIPAGGAGADHKRRRTILVGHTDGKGQPDSAIDAEVAGMPRTRPVAGGAGAAHGTTRRMDVARRRMIGNSVYVPAFIEIGRAILAAASDQGKAA